MRPRNKGSNQSDETSAKSCEDIRDYMRKKRAKVKATTTIPPSPDEEEEVDATADPPPSSPGDAETTAVDALMTMTKTHTMTTMVCGTQPLRSMQSWRRGAARSTMMTATPAADEAKQSSERLKAAAEAKQRNERLQVQGIYFPKTVRELIMSNKCWTESAQPLESCRANEAMQLNVMTVAKAGGCV